MSCPDHEEMKEDMSHLRDSLYDFKEMAARLTVSIEKLGETTVSIQQYYEQNKAITDENAQIQIEIGKVRTWLKVITIVGIIGFTILFGMHGFDLPKIL